MGVMRCNRKGCENIMCERLSSRFGYLCNECFEELVASRTCDIMKFMKRSKIQYPPDVEWYDEVFRKLK